MKTTYPPLRRLMLLLALVLLACASRALAEGSFQAVVSVDEMKVYAQASPHNVIGTLPAAEGVTAPVVAFIAHMDTSPAASGENVKAREVFYDGTDLQAKWQYLYQLKLLERYRP